MKKIFTFATLLYFFTSNANALILDPYVGLDYNHNKMNFDHKTEDLYDDNYNSVGVVAGIKLLSMLSVEGFYQKSAEKDNSIKNYFIDGDNVKTKMQLESYGVDLVSDMLNLGIVEVLSSVGYGYYDASVSRFVTVSGETGHKNYNEEGNGLRFGIGAQINPTPSIGIRAMLRYTITDMDTVKNIKEFTLGLRYYF